jgi:hypothetical protein
MLGTIFYSIGCFVVALILTTIIMMTRPIQDRGESKPWRTIIILTILVALAPYGYIEVLTKLYAIKMQKAVVQGFDSAPIDGPLKFYKIVWYTGDTAKAIAVGEEKESWGGTDRPLVAITLKHDKDSDDWKCDSYRLVYSSRQNKDGMSFPPYW